MTLKSIPILAGWNKLTRRKIESLIVGTKNRISARNATDEINLERAVGRQLLHALP